LFLLSEIAFFLNSAAQEMNMFRHHDILNHYEAVPLAHMFEDEKQSVAVNPAWSE